MTRVEVLTGVPDPVVYACKFLRKTQASPAAQSVPSPRHMVCGPVEVLKRLDAQLWTLDAHSFIPHAWTDPAPAPPVVERTPIWLGPAPVPGLGCTVLVNLHEAPTEGWQAFDRVVEFVGTQDEQVIAGRQRWKAYGQPGVERVHHAVAGAS
jgi:DNA polymerase III subunit chi